MSLCQPVIWSMAAMLRDSIVVVVRMRPRAIPLAMTLYFQVQVLC